MKTILAIGAAAAALMAASSAASAQDCVNGWKMIKDQIPVTCDEFQPAFAGPMQPLEEPLYTGSISKTPVTTEIAGGGNSEQLPGDSNWNFAASREDCAPGHFWMLDLESGDRPVAC